MVLRRQASVSSRSTPTKRKTDTRLARHFHLARAGQTHLNLFKRSCRHWRGVKVAGFGEVAEIESSGFSFGVVLADNAADDHVQDILSDALAIDCRGPGVRPVRPLETHSGSPR